MNVERQRNLVVMAGLGMIVGAVAGGGAWVFRELIGFFQNLLFQGRLGFDFDPTAPIPPSPWGAGIILVPPLTAIVVAWLVKTFAPEAKSHGVPEVMDAVHYRDARMRPRVVVVKALASSLSIGSGGSAGREGPIIQIGAALGSTLGQIVAMPVRQRVTLVAAGAGAGIAAAFDAPLGGILFACELILVGINAATVLPVALACVLGAWITRLTTGLNPTIDIPSLQIPQSHVAQGEALALFLLLGLGIGGLMALFIRALDVAERFFPRLPGGYIAQHAFGMLLLGLLIYGLFRMTGRYDVAGVGYATVVQILTLVLSDPWFLLALALLKMLATCLTLGSGASGGVFSPCMFMGAAAGAAFGHLSHDLIPGLAMPVPAFAVAGMAAAVAGAMGAFLTAIVMSYEMTRDYAATLPVIITCAVAWATRRYLVSDSIYTIKLIARGHVVPEGLQAGTTSARRMSDVMSDRFILAPAPVPSADRTVLVVEGGRIAGLARPDGTVQPVIATTPAALLSDALREAMSTGAAAAVVFDDPERGDPREIRGIVTAREIADTVDRDARLMG